MFYPDNPEDEILNIKMAFKIIKKIKPKNVNNRLSIYFCFFERI